jgi:DNA-binding response OmpR family regulator
MKLLVAEDEPKTGAYLQQGLSEAGFNGPGYDRYRCSTARAE